MRKSLGIVILISILSWNASAQRNTVRFIGFNYDNCIKNTNSVGNQVQSNAGFLFSYQRSFGDYLALSLDLMLPFSTVFSSGSTKEQLIIDPDYYAAHSTSYRSYTYSETHSWGLHYTSKFFITGFDEEPEGLYIAPVIGYDRYELIMKDNSSEAFENGSATGNITTINDVTKNYGVFRYGLKLGLEGSAGELYVGYFFNSAMGKDDGLPFGPTNVQINSSNLTVGYVWGFTF